MHGPQKVVFEYLDGLLIRNAAIEYRWSLSAGGHKTGFTVK